jgi:hypothetical protein
VRGKVNDGPTASGSLAENGNSGGGGFGCARSDSGTALRGFPAGELDVAWAGIPAGPAGVRTVGTHRTEGIGSSP